MDGYELYESVSEKISITAALYEDKVKGNLDSEIYNLLSNTLKTEEVLFGKNVKRFKKVSNALKLLLTE